MTYRYSQNWKSVESFRVNGFKRMYLGFKIAKHQSSPAGLVLLPFRAFFEALKPSHIWTTKDTFYAVRLSLVATPNYVKLYGPLGCIAAVALIVAFSVGPSKEKIITLFFLGPSLVLATWSWKIYVLALAKKLRQPTHFVTDFLTFTSAQEFTKQDFFESVLMRYHHLGGCYGTITSVPGTFEDLGFEIITNPEASQASQTKTMLRLPTKQEVTTSKKLLAEF